MELNEKEAHCLARLLQSALYAGVEGILAGCQYCKYQCTDRELRLVEIQKRLTEETGVDLNPSGETFLIHSKFPYHRFLRNANEPIKEYFRTRFDVICRPLS